MNMSLSEQMTDTNAGTNLGVEPGDAQTFAQSMSIDDSESSGLPSHAGKIKSVGVIACVVAISAGALFGMRQLGLHGMIAMPDIKIDYPLEGGDVSVVTADHARLITELNSSGSISQVPLEDLTMNPFEWKVNEETTVVETFTGPDPGEIARQKLQQRQRELQTAFGKLRLNSILGGPNPVATINGELVSMGDRVGSHFVVHGIFGRQVELMAEGEIYTLALGE